MIRANIQGLSKPLPFDHHDAALLLAAGYEHEFVPECWRDVGGPESGPKIVGNPNMDVFTLDVSGHSMHVIIVVDSEIVEAEYQPKPPPGWEDQF